MGPFTYAAMRRVAPMRICSLRTSDRRWNSNQPSAAKPVSPHVGFYKTFTRPVAKVLLMATFTYQLAYWAWVKLEKDEIKRERTAEIQGLEKQLEALTEKKGKD